MGGGCGRGAIVAREIKSRAVERTSQMTRSRLVCFLFVPVVFSPPHFNDNGGSSRRPSQIARNRALGSAKQQAHLSVTGSDGRATVAVQGRRGVSSRRVLGFRGTVKQFAGTPGFEIGPFLVRNREKNQRSGEGEKMEQAGRVDETGGSLGLAAGSPQRRRKWPGAAVAFQ